MNMVDFHPNHCFEICFDQNSPPLFASFQTFMLQNFIFKSSQNRTLSIKFYENMFSDQKRTNA